MSKSEQRRATGKCRRAKDKLATAKITCQNPSSLVVLANVSTNHGSTLTQLRRVANHPAIPPLMLALPHGRSFSLLQFANDESGRDFVNQFDEAWIPELGLCLALAWANPAHKDIVAVLAHRASWQSVIASTEQATLPDGLHLLTDFVSVDEERALLAELEADEQLFRSLRTRTVAQWGYAFDYSTFGAVALPNPVTPLTQQLMSRLPFLDSDSVVFPSNSQSCVPRDSTYQPPNQCTLNRYRPGDGIPAHADDPNVFGQAIWVLSLGHPLSMEFAPLVPESSTGTTDAHTTGDNLPDDSLAAEFGAANLGKSTQGRARDITRRLSLWLPARSMLVMTGSARYDWTHGIAQRKTDLVDGEVRARGTRTSLTFRRVLSHP
eukprot:m.55873 g.55873  ORF g.55873 m.55873 type:complete len:379 (+) comp13666_c0_seq1:79-1215(+)